jgi:hypothetical protein
MKTVRILALVVSLPFGLAAFTPQAFACGGTGMSGCKQVAAPAFWLAQVRALSSLFDVLIP